MAKDGTNRGGARIGAGRKKKALDEKILFGNADPATVKILPLPTGELSGADIPNPKDYLVEEQHDGTKTYAEQIYRDTYKWLKSCNCEQLVTKEAIENFAEISARQIQCEKAISRYGFLSKHPTTGAPITSPFVKMSLDYMKQVNQQWMQIYQVVKQNYSRTYTKNSAHAQMEKLLRKVK